MGLYAKIDVNLPKDKAVRKCGLLGELLWVRIILFCKETNSDGVVDRDQLPIIAAGFPRGSASKLIQMLASFGLVIATPHGWKIEESKWARYQTTSGQVQDIQRKRSEAGRVGAARRWQIDGKQDGKLPSPCHSDAIDAPMANGCTEGEGEQRQREGGSRTREAQPPAHPAPHPSTASSKSEVPPGDDVVADELARLIEAHPAEWKLRPQSAGNRQQRRAALQRRIDADGEAWVRRAVEAICSRRDAETDRLWRAVARWPDGVLPGAEGEDRLEQVLEHVEGEGDELESDTKPRQSHSENIPTYRAVSAAMRERFLAAFHAAGGAGEWRNSWTAAHDEVRAIAKANGRSWHPDPLFADYANDADAMRALVADPDSLSAEKVIAAFEQQAVSRPTGGSGA